MDLAPGDPLSGLDLADMTLEEVNALRAEMGLDDPLLVRYGRYMFRLLQGDLGVSDISGISVWETFINRLPNTLILASTALVIGVAIAIPMGILAAKRAGKISDNIITGFTLIGMSMPGFWLGILLILLFSHQLGWFPASGFRDGWRSVALPALCSAMTLLASTARQTRSSMLEVLKSDYLRTARAKGVPEGVVTRKHALGNALIPIVTNVGLAFGVAISGTAVIEAVFAWPGIGRFVVESVTARDVTATTGAVILTTVLYVLVQLLVDIAYAWIDPRIKAQYVAKGKKKRRSEKPVTTTVTPRFQQPILSDTATLELEQGDFSKQAVTQSVQNESLQDSELKKNAMSESNDYTIEEANSFATSTAPDPAIAVKINDSGNTAEYKSGSISDSTVCTDVADLSDAEVESTIRTHRKRSQMGEIFFHLVRNKGAVAGLVIISVMTLLFIATLFIPFEAVTSASIQDRFSPPSGEFPFGTDAMGRNQFVRVIYATRFSLPIGFGASAIAAIVGVLLGSLASYYEGTAADEVIMRFSDVFAAIPSILLGMVIITTLGRSLTNLTIAVGVAAIPLFIRTSRASTLTVKGSEFVEAARAIGLSNFRIIFTQILPNGLAPIIIQFTIVLGLTILISAALSFLGFGIPVPNPEWGALVATGRDHIRTAPWLTTFPGLFIMGTVMAFNLLGDGLRDALDPKLKK